VSICSRCRLLERIARRPPRDHLVRVGRRDRDQLARRARQLAAVDLDRRAADDAVALRDDRHLVLDAAVGLGGGLDPVELETARPVLLQRKDRHRDPAGPVPGDQRWIPPARDDRRFCDQILDSAASGPANLAEGFGYYRHPEFAKHTRIAKASLMETHNLLGDGVDRGFWSADRIGPLLKLADRAIGATVGLLQHLETTDAPGTMGKPRRTGTTFRKRER
jgi:four helix bundle protein